MTIDKAKQLSDDKKSTVAFMKNRIEELDASMSKNFVAKNYTLASHDAKQMAVLMEVLSQVDLNG